MQKKKHTTHQDMTFIHFIIEKNIRELNCLQRAHTDYAVYPLELKICMLRKTFLSSLRRLSSTQKPCMLFWLLEALEHIPNFMQNCTKDGHISFEQSSVSTANNKNP